MTLNTRLKELGGRKRAEKGRRERKKYPANDRGLKCVLELDGGYEIKINEIGIIFKIKLKKSFKIRSKICLYGCVMNI